MTVAGGAQQASWWYWLHRKGPNTRCRSLGTGRPRWGSTRNSSSVGPSSILDGPNVTWGRFIHWAAIGGPQRNCRIRNNNKYGVCAAAGDTLAKGRSCECADVPLSLRLGTVVVLEEPVVGSIVLPCGVVCISTFARPSFCKGVTSGCMVPSPLFPDN